MKKTSIFVTLGMLVLGVVLFGCTGTTSLNQTPGQSNQNYSEALPGTLTSASISIANYAFSPPSVEIADGGTVTWTNNDNVDHTVTLDSLGISSGNIRPGQTYQYTFSSLGTYQYHCSIHTTMQGNVIVK